MSRAVEAGPRNARRWSLSPGFPRVAESVPHLRCNALKRLTRRRTPYPRKSPDKTRQRTQDRPKGEPRCCGTASLCGVNIVSRRKLLLQSGAAQGTRTIACETRASLVIVVGILKAYVKRNKNDAADAEAICEAVGRPRMRFVRAKSAEQQGRLMQHRTRDLLMRHRRLGRTSGQAQRQFQAWGLGPEAPL
jgi:hypothetical protein